MGNGTRKCARCSADSADVPFKKDKRASDGLGAYCLSCQRDYNSAHYADNRARLNAENNSRYHENKDAVLAQQREYRQANAERIKEYDRARYAADPVRRNKHVAVWLEANRERYKSVSRQYVINNRDRIYNQATVKRLAAAGFNAPHESISRQAVWDAYDGRCGICGDPVEFLNMDIDHIYPVSRGGAHLYSNVQPSHRPCNAGKRDKIL